MNRFTLDMRVRKPNERIEVMPVVVDVEIETKQQIGREVSIHYTIETGVTQRWGVAKDNSYRLDDMADSIEVSILKPLFEELDKPDKHKVTVI